MLALGRLFVQGLGVLQDYVEAHKWFNLAASRGAVEAVAERDALGANMTPSQIEAAQRRAAEWQAENAAAALTPPRVDAAEPETPAPGEPAADVPPEPPSADEIVEAQELLAALGYEPGAADGRWGPRSARAYAAFLRDVALPPEETLSPEGLQALRQEARRGWTEPEAPALSQPAPDPDGDGDAATTLSSAGPSTADTLATVASLVIQGLYAYQLAKVMRDPERYNRVAPELQTLLSKMVQGLTATDLMGGADADVSLGALTTQEQSRLSDLLRQDEGLPERTRTALSDALQRVPDQAAAIGPKCADLPGPYLDENHAECWVEMENQPGCHVWDFHFHSDQTARWSGRCAGGIAEGRGTLSVSAGSEHDAWEGTGTISGGKLNGRWVEEWSSGARSDAEYRDGKVHGHGIIVWSEGDRYEGEWRNSRHHGRGTFTYVNGDRYEGEWQDGSRHGRGTYVFTSGSRYEGEWRDGKAHGYGTVTWSDGRREQGTWRNGCVEARDGGDWMALGASAAECGFE